MTSMPWLKWYAGTIEDPKLRIVAKRANANPCVVVAVWAAMLEAAGKASDRGSVAEIDLDIIELCLDVDEWLYTAIYDAMQGKLLDGDKIRAWDERQKNTNAERQKRYRDKKAVAQRNVTERNNDNSSNVKLQGSNESVTREEELELELELEGEGDKNASAQALPSKSDKQSLPAKQKAPPPSDQMAIDVLADKPGAEHLKPLPANDPSKRNLSDADQWRMEVSMQPWAIALKRAGAHIGPNNWVTWQGALDRTTRGDFDALASFVASLRIPKKFPQEVEEQFIKQRPSEADGELVEL